MYGCAKGCTWQEMAAVCGLAVLATAIFAGWAVWMVRKYKKLEKHSEDGEA